MTDPRVKERMPSKKKDQAPRKPKKTSTPKAPAESSPQQPDASNAEALRKLYVSLLRCRMVQERVRQVSPDDTTGGRYDLAIGREAVVAGASADLGEGDTAAVSPRNLAAVIARGLPLSALCTSGNSWLSFAGVIATEDPFNWGTGIALAHKLESKRHVVVALAVQPTPPLHAWHDALKFAGVHKLPIVYIIENGVATEAPTYHDSPHLEAVSFMARDYGFPGIIVDGDDAVAVWRVAQEGIHRARNGGGPTLVDCRTDAGRDPLPYMEHYLKKRAAWDEAWHRRVRSEISAALDEALEGSLPATR